jgi:hypothetical protein
MEPATDARPPDRPGLSGQHQERGLEGVFGVGVGAADLSAGSPDGRSVSPDEKLERGGIMIADEPTEKVSVRDVVAGWAGGEQSEGEPSGHGWFQVGRARPLPI